MTPPSFDDPVHVLAHARWLDALARELVADPGEAADLAQATQVAALEARPDSSRPLRGWLATVMRNLLRQSRRGALRRALREQACAAREATPSAADLAARFDAHRRVVDAVAALDEPYRATILLRYFEGKSPGAIAAEQGVPVATVKTRQQRALALLRRRLDREFGGDGKSWAIALFPLAGHAPASFASAAAAGAVLMNVKLVALVAVVVVGAGIALFSRSDRPAAADADGAPPAATSPPRPAAPPELIGTPAIRTTADAERAPDPAKASPPAPGAEPAASAGDPATRVHGRVLDATAQPAPGVELAFVDGLDGDKSASESGLSTAAPLRSGPDGTFECEPPSGWHRIVAASEGLATVFAAARSAGNRDRLVVVVAPAVAYGGVVVDEAGQPVAGAEVALRLPFGFRARFRDVLDTAMEEIAKGIESGADGRFTIDVAPGVDRATLMAGRIGYEPALVPAPEAGAAEMRLVLRKPATAGQRVEGVVVDPAGALVEGAYVSLRGEITLTDAAGRFALDVDDTAWMRRLAEQFHAPKEFIASHFAIAGMGRASPLGARIVAVKGGHQPAVRAAQPTASGPEFPSFVVLTLGPAPLAIEGVVLGVDGAPAAGAQVWIDDPSLFGMLDGDSAVVVENLAAGANGHDWRAEKTDATGRFRLEGLADRAYRVVAMDDRLLRVAKPGVAAGTTDAVIRFPAGAVHPSVRGRVVTKSGKAVAGARVHTQNDAFSIGGSTRHGGAEATETDAAGRFELKDVPKEGVYLRVDGDGIIPLEYGRAAPRLEDEAKVPITELVLTVSARCHLRVELRDAAAADAFGVLDAAGQPMSIELFQGNVRESRPRFDIVDGKSPVVAVPQDAATVVLYRAGLEVKRIAIELVEGEVNTVEG